MKNPDMTTRILAVVLALFLWASVRMVVKAPDLRRTVHDVPVTAGESTTYGFVYKITPSQIDVDVKGPSELISNLPPVTATVNVSGITTSTTLREVEISGLPGGVSYTHKKVSVTPIEVSSKEFQITTLFMPQLPMHKMVGTYHFVPDDTVTVEGTKEDLAQVKYVVIHLDPTSDRIGFEQEVVPRPINADGDYVASVKVLPATVKVSVTFVNK